MDFSDISANPIRAINFLSFLFIYMEYRNEIYSNYGCIEWEDYNKKRRKVLEAITN